MDLHQATEAGDVERVRELLAQGMDVNARDRYYNTPLLYAISNEKLDMVRFLVDQGADIDAPDRNGWTPIDFAVAADSFRIFDLVVSLGAKIRTRDNNGRTVLHTIVRLGRGPRWVNRLFDAVDDDPNIWFSLKTNNQEDTPLHVVTTLASAKCLVEYGFDSSTSGVQSTWMCPTLLSIRNKEDVTPRERAAKLRRTDAAKYFDSFESFPLIDLTTMRLSRGLNEFQRFLASRIYFTVLCKLSPGDDVALRVMAFLAPVDVMK
jgi:hypothetical protein